jgi:transcription termination factor Rho
VPLDEVADDRDAARARQERAPGERPRGGRDLRPVGDRAERDRPAPERAPADRQQGERGDRSATDRDRDRPRSDRPSEDRDPASRSEQGDRGNGANGRQQPGQGNVAPAAPVNGQAEEGEGGNRRRRRRNRDRVEGQVDRPEGSVDESFSGDPVPCAGLLDLREEGYGFLRVKGYLPHRDDVYVSVRQVRQLGLRKGDHLAGASRPANRQEKNPALLRIDQVNGQDPESARRRPRFEDLTPLFPDEKLRLEMPTDPTNMTARIVDLVAPIGKGQRGLIVSPPKAGKTTILKQIVRSIERNDPDVHLMVLLVDERPEEVTDMRRSTSGEVIASTFDRPSDEHTSVSELVIERAKRLVEEGKDVVIVLDGITRLARAYNLAAPSTGRIMSGGIDTGALYPPKKFFGAARNIEEGGSLTILATALIETGSKMDEVIFEEFKGTGNMELRLDRRLAERRIYPAIDVDASSTRHEELLFSRQQLQQVWRVRRALHALSSDAGSPAAALERLMDGMKTFKTNDEFLAEAAKASGPAT